MKVVTSGCYFLYNKGTLVYVGESNNILGRIGEHIREGAKKFDEFEYIELDETNRKNMETFLIDIIKPKYNKANGKGYDKYIRKSSFNDWSLEYKKYDKECKDFCINIYNNIEKYVNIKDIEKNVEISYPRLLIILEELKAPLYKDNVRNGYIIEKQWLYKNIKKLYENINKDY